MAMREYRIQLKDRATGATIITAGGLCYVAVAGAANKATLFDKTGAALANPLIPTRGFINFFTADTVASVDLYIQAPGGQFVVAAGVVASGNNEIVVDTLNRRQIYKIPFSIADCVAATEKDTGFILPLGYVLNRLHGCGLQMTVLETTGAKTMLVGTLSSQAGGSANGFINASSTAALGQVIGTDGGSFSTNAPYATDSQTAKNVSYTLVTASVTAAGFINLPVVLAA